ncbi:hypothetical protein MEO93_20925 [Dolichospermum sp. ST_sed3]|nr:hypothetical protein [Dolichospermum sp. ST_sed3]
MEVKELSYQEKVKILKDIFDSTNIVLTGAYGASSKINSTNIFLVENRNVYECYEDDKSTMGLISINTGICTG